MEYASCSADAHDGHSFSIQTTKHAAVVDGGVMFISAFTAADARAAFAGIGAVEIALVSSSLSQQVHFD